MDHEHSHDHAYLHEHNICTTNQMSTMRRTIMPTATTPQTVTAMCTKTRRPS